MNGNLYVYDMAAYSAWLTTKFAVTPGASNSQARVILADTFDGLKDSTVLLDNMRWEAAERVAAPGAPRSRLQGLP